MDPAASSRRAAVRSSSARCRHVDGRRHVVRRDQAAVRRLRVRRTSYGASSSTRASGTSSATSWRTRAWWEDTAASTTPYVESPDGRVGKLSCSTTTSTSARRGAVTPFSLTTDGEEFHGYGLTYPRPNQVRNKTPRRPSLRWSPDSRRIAVQRTDEREVAHHHYISMTPQRPSTSRTPTRSRATRSSRCPGFMF